MGNQAFLLFLTLEEIISQTIKRKRKRLEQRLSLKHNLRWHQKNVNAQSRNIYKHNKKKLKFFAERTPSYFPIKNEPMNHQLKEDRASKKTGYNMPKKRKTENNNTKNFRNGRQLTVKETELHDKYDILFKPQPTGYTSGRFKSNIWRESRYIPGSRLMV